MLGHINEGIKHKYSLIILHPNKNEDSKTGGLLKGHEGMEEHCRTVWNELISQCPAKSLYIVAFSAGGPCLHSVYSGDRKYRNFIFIRGNILLSSGCCSYV